MKESLISTVVVEKGKEADIRQSSLMMRNDGFLPPKKELTLLDRPVITAINELTRERQAARSTGRGRSGTGRCWRCRRTACGPG